MEEGGGTRDVVLYFSGGAMLGVFSAGVATYIDERDLLGRIKAVHATSAGAFSGAYLLARQARLGSSIYYEDLTKGFCAPFFVFLWGIWQRIFRNIVGVSTFVGLRDALDLEYLIRVARSSKMLNTSVFDNISIPFYIRLYNLTKRRSETMIVSSQNILRLLRAAVETLPYTHAPQSIGDSLYMDAGVEVIGFEKLRAMYPEDKIVVVLNAEKKRRWIRHQLKRLIEGKIISYMFDTDLLPYFRESETQLKEDIEMIENDPQATLVHIPRGSRVFSSTTNSEKLRWLHRAGIDAGKKVEVFMTKEKTA